MSYIDGKPYLVRLPLGGNGDFQEIKNLFRRLGFKSKRPVEWDRIAHLSCDDDSIFHWDTICSWCEDTEDHTIPYIHHVLRGGRAFGFHFSLPSSCENTFIGRRPVLVPLNSETLQPDPQQLSHISDGTAVSLGTLFINGRPQDHPTIPTASGDIPRYLFSAELRIGDTHPDPDKQIRWIKNGNTLIANCNLVRGISWKDLARQGLASGYPPRAPGQTQINQNPQQPLLRL